MFDVRIVGSVKMADGGEDSAEDLRMAIMRDLEENFSKLFGKHGLFEIKVFTIGERFEVYPPGWKEYSDHD